MRAITRSPPPNLGPLIANLNATRAVSQHKWVALLASST
jgi:hypothetical protein